MEKTTICRHIDAISELKHSKTDVCEECVKLNTQWVHLRVCQTCGRTLCCDSSPERHMSHHCRKSGHPVIISAEPGERWIYCFQDDVGSDY